MRTGRPHKLSAGAEWELFCMYLAHGKLKKCATAFGISKPTADRIVAKFKRQHGEQAGQLARDFRYRLERLREST